MNKKNIIIKRVKDNQCNICFSSDVINNNNRNRIKLYEIYFNHNVVVLCNDCLFEMREVISNKSLKNIDNIYDYENGKTIKISDLKSTEPSIYNLLFDIFGGDDNKYINYDVENNIKEAFKSLTIQESKFIIMKYKERYTYEKIALLNNTNQSKVSETILRSISRLRNKRNTNIFLYGITDNNDSQNITIEEFDERFTHSTALLNCLRRAGFDTIYDVIEHSETELKLIKRVGPKTIHILKRGLKKANLSLKYDLFEL